MPKISQGFKTTTVSLPSYDGSEVIVRTSISVDDLSKTEGLEGLDHSAGLLERLIVSWNFEDEQGAPLAISTENIKQLPVADLKFLMDTMMPHLQKKTVASEKTSSSTPSEGEDTSH
jgi:hypothetical protein